METKAEKFIRLAASRVEKAMDAIRVVGNLASSNYEYSDQARDEVIQALQDSVEAVAQEFGVTVTGQTVKPLQGGSTSPQTTAPTTPDPSKPNKHLTPVVLTREEMDYDGPIDAEDIRSAIRIISYNGDPIGALKLLRNALIMEPRNEPKGPDRNIPQTEEDED